MTAVAETRRLPASTYLLSLGQALNLTAAVISVTVAALVGIKLAPSSTWATVPYGAQFASVMLCTYPAAMLMRNRGRRFGFAVGGVMLMIAGVLGYLSVARASFAGLILTHAFLGAYIACANFYRFAAVDTIPTQQKAKAISLVVSGGVLAAVLGPLLSTALRDVHGHAEFALCYAALCGLSVLTFVILTFWKPPAEAATATTSQPATTERFGMKGNYLILIGILSAAAGYFVMNLLMVQSSLVMKDLCSFSAASVAIQGHVLAMFGPSFFTGRLILKVGVRQVLILGFALLAISAGIAVAQPLSYSAVVAGLLVLGLGWNFSYVGGGALLAQSVPNRQRHAWQGVNDTVIAACATLGAFLPSPLLSLMGWSGSNLLCLLLCLAVATVCWLGYSMRKGLSAVENSHAGTR